MGEKVEDGKIYEVFSYLLNNLIFIFFLKRGKGLSKYMRYEV